MPFLLFMSWLQVHLPLHAGLEFKKASQHGHYGDEVSVHICSPDSCHVSNNLASSDSYVRRGFHWF